MYSSIFCLPLPSHSQNKNHYSVFVSTMGYWKKNINDSGLELEFDNAFDEDTGVINKENDF